MQDAMTDHIAKTRAQLEACAKRGQWQAVMNIGGFKSIEAAKDAFKKIVLVQELSKTLYMRPNIKKPVRDTAGMIEAVKALPEPRVFNNQQGTFVQPAKRDWVLKCRGRIAAMGLTLGEVSISMGYNKSYLPNRFTAQNHCSADAIERIDAHLDILETQVKSA